MADGVPEGLDGLTGEGAAGGIGDRDREDDWPAHAAFLEDLLAGEDRSLEVQRVKDGLKQEQVDPAVEQCLDLLGIGVDESIEGDSTVAGIVHVGRHRGGAIGRPDRSGYKDAATGMGRHEFLRSLARDLGTSQVDLVNGILQGVVGLRNRGSAEGVGLDDIAACLEIGAMDPLDDFGAGDGEEVVIPLQVVAVPLETLTAEVLLRQRVPLDHRPHGSVE